MKKIFYKDLELLVHDQVYEPGEDSFLLADNLNVKKCEQVLDLGTGCGLQAIHAAKQGGSVVATDINPKAIECAKKNATDNYETIDFREGDLFSPVQGERFDVIIFNPPYLQKEEEPKDWIDYSYSSSEVMVRFLEEYKDYLGENGRAYIVNSSLSGVELAGKIIARKKVAFEELFVVELKKAP